MKEKLRKIEGESSVYKEPARYYPTIRLTEDDLPAIKDWEVGKKYKLVIEAEMIGLTKGSEWDQNSKDKETRASFKVTKVGINEPKDTKLTEKEMAERTRPGSGSRYAGSRS